MDLAIQEYRADDEKEWLRCHALVYSDSSEGRRELAKRSYTGKSIELVALVDEKIVGFLDIELEETPGSLCYRKLEGNAMLWEIGVLPEFRRKGAATKLLDEGIKRGKVLGMRRLEAWSIEQDAWKFYENYGFKKFFEYYHVLLKNREKLRAFDKDGMHIVEIYAHVTSETDLKTIIEKYETRAFPCCGFELIL